jgi:hypothetical protein
MGLADSLREILVQAGHRKNLPSINLLSASEQLTEKTGAYGTYCLKPGFLLNSPQRNGTPGEDSGFDILSQINTPNKSHGGDSRRINSKVFKSNQTLGEYGIK